MNFSGISLRTSQKMPETGPSYKQTQQSSAAGGTADVFVAELMPNAAETTRRYRRTPLDLGGAAKARASRGKVYLSCRQSPAVRSLSEEGAMAAFTSCTRSAHVHCHA